MSATHPLLPAIVLGANGQDGSYLAETLLRRGYSVTGVARQAESRWVNGAQYRHLGLDLRDSDALARLLEAEVPQEIYHFAAVHGASGFEYEPLWRDAVAVNVSALHACLEYARARPNACKVFYASSLKAFETPASGIINEDTPRRSSCLYSITKNAAADLIAYYRNAHSVRAAIGYFFNHDSPRRPGHFFLPRLAAQLASALGARGANAEPLATLAFSCDWGSSEEFMSFAADLLQLDCPPDCIFASGKTWAATDLVAALSTAAKLSAAQWLKVRDASPPHPGSAIQADITRLADAVGRRPRMDAMAVVRSILAQNYGIMLGAERAA